MAIMENMEQAAEYGEQTFGRGGDPDDNSDPGALPDRALEAYHKTLAAWRSEKKAAAAAVEKAGRERDDLLEAFGYLENNYFTLKMLWLRRENVLRDFVKIIEDAAAAGQPVDAERLLSKIIATFGSEGYRLLSEFKPEPFHAPEGSIEERAKALLALEREAASSGYWNPDEDPYNWAAVFAGNIEGFAG